MNALVVNYNRSVRGRTVRTVRKNEAPDSVTTKDNVTLRGLTWDHPRGWKPLARVSPLWSERNEGRGVTVVWDRQPLSGFESRPLAEIASEYDLLVIDHPHVGDAAASQCLIPFSEDVSDAFVGPSFASYHYQGRQWALPIDAACQVSAFRRSAVGTPPRTHEDALERAYNGLRMALPLSGVHSLMALLSLLAGAGHPLTEEAGWPDESFVADAADLLRRLSDASDAESRTENPIQTLERMAAGETDYAPLIFGYASYAGPEIAFAPPPAFSAESRAQGAILGGTGIAVSAKGRHIAQAQDFARFAASAPIQTKYWADEGGQPAHRAAWDALSETRPFYRDTRPAIETAYVRPRFPGWNALQCEAGEIIHDWLNQKNASGAELARTLKERCKR